VAQVHHRCGMAHTPLRQPSDIVKLTPAEIRRIAAEAGVEPRTAAKFLRGQRVVSTCADRIRRAIATFMRSAAKDPRR
jgi:hypothetical protein